jgi:hypothetical protein
MTKRNSIRITVTSSFVIAGPYEDELTEIATEAGIRGEEPTEEELDAAYKNWQESVEEDFENGAEIPDTAATSVEFEEVINEEVANKVPL